MKAFKLYLVVAIIFSFTGCGQSPLAQLLRDKARNTFLTPPTFLFSTTDESDPDVLSDPPKDPNSL